MGTSTDATIGGFSLQVGDGASPEVFTENCEVYVIPRFGETNDLVEITSFCNAGSRQYKPGLSDGMELEFQFNHLPASLTQERLRDAVRAKSTINVKLVDTNVSPNEEYLMNVVALGWGIEPVVDDRNTFVFSCKINTITVP